ncbi:MAG: coiled-coil domain-containing protein [Actinomycetota bacterium]
MGENGTTAQNGSGRRRIAAVVLALAMLAGATSAAGARPPIEAARQRAERLGRQVVDARASAAELQSLILSLASDVAAARRALDRLQGRLVEAQHELGAAQAEVEAVQARLNDRARQAFVTLGPGASAAYLLGADSFSDLLDRTVMLGSVQQADAALAAEVKAEVARVASVRATLEQATGRRDQLLARIESRQTDLLSTLAAQQAALERLAGQQRDAVRDVRTLERKIARHSGALPFGDWADRFLEHLGAPTCRHNLVVVVAWQANEFTEARWNPLATTHRMARSTSFNDVGVQNYVSLTQGLRASVGTLTGGATSFGYQAILDSLGRCDAALTTAEAIQASAWCRGCSNGRYVTELVPVVQAYFDRYLTLHT